MRRETAGKLRLLVLIYGISVGYQYLWEMVQMPLYAGMSYGRIEDWAACLRAGLGDGAMTLGIYALGALVFGGRAWPRWLGFREAAFLVAAGAAFAVPAELASLAMERWTYSPLMPRVPRTGMGVAPLAQMIVLPVLSFRTALRLAPASVSG
jgi:hypothetical protein